MAGRFPGAPNVDELWRRVAAGEDCLVDLSTRSLRADTCQSAEARRPRLRRAQRECSTTSRPSTRSSSGSASATRRSWTPSIATSWSAAGKRSRPLGTSPSASTGSIGVFAGCGINTYMLSNLLTNPDLVDQVGMFLLRHTGERQGLLGDDGLVPTRPARSRRSTCRRRARHRSSRCISPCRACSRSSATSRSPAARPSKCRTARGYKYHEGEVLSPDGYCRAFDERSAGTVLTSGAGVVALRRSRTRSTIATRSSR